METADLDSLRGIDIPQETEARKIEKSKGKSSYPKQTSDQISSESKSHPR